MQKLKRGVIQPLVRPIYIELRPDYRRSIFLAGTEKSGTTWVSEIINYRREYRYVFEPFWPAKVSICAPFRPQQYLRPENHERRYLQAAETILSGRLRNRWADRYHRRFVARQRLIKDIRANLFLKWLHGHFPGMPIILLLRHPCAVARSHLRRTHLHPDLGPLLAQEELMADYIEPFRAEMEAARTDFEKYVFRWCVETYVPLRQFRRGEIHLAFYEHYCACPEPEIKRLFSFLGKTFDPAALERLGRPSLVARAESAIVSGGSLVDDWRKQITEEQIERAVEILGLFGLDKIYAEGSMPNVPGAYELMDRGPACEPPGQGGLATC